MQDLYFPIKDHGPTLQSQGLMPSFEFSVLDMPLGQQPVPNEEYVEDLEESVQYLDDDVCEECKRKAMRKYRDPTLPDPGTFDPGYATRSSSARRQRGFDEARMRGYAARREEEREERKQAGLLGAERRRQREEAEYLAGQTQITGFFGQGRAKTSAKPPITQSTAARGRTRQRKDDPGERYRSRSRGPGQFVPEPGPGQFVPESKEPEGTFINTDPEPMGPPPPRRRRL